MWEGKNPNPLGFYGLGPVLGLEVVDTDVGLVSGSIKHPFIDHPPLAKIADGISHARTLPATLFS